MMITSKLLKSKGACSGQLSKFKELFPNGVIPTRKLCLAHAEDFDWSWAAEKLLSEEGFAAFKKAEAIAWKAYKEAEAIAWKAYKEAEAIAWKAYCEVIAIAWFDIWQKENP